MELKHDRLAARDPGLDEDGEVSDLVRDLVEEDGEGGDHAHALPGQEARAHRQSVSEVVEAVRREVEVTSNLDLLPLILGAITLLLLLLFGLFLFLVTIFLRI